MKQMYGEQHYFVDAMGEVSISVIRRTLLNRHNNAGILPTPGCDLAQSTS